MRRNSRLGFFFQQAPWPGRPSARAWATSSASPRAARRTGMTLAGATSGCRPRTRDTGEWNMANKLKLEKNVTFTTDLSCSEFLLQVGNSASPSSKGWSRRWNFAPWAKGQCPMEHCSTLWYQQSIIHYDINNPKSSTNHQGSKNLNNLSPNIYKTQINQQFKNDH